MNKSNSIGAIDGTDLSEQTKFRLDELSKLNSIDTLISQALIDMDKSHEEFITILKEKIDMK